MPRARRLIVAAGLLAGPIVCPAQADLAGYLSVEPRAFFDAPAFAGQTAETISFSAVAAPELRREWNDSNDRLTVVPYLRFDADDDKRSHFDLREANWQRYAGPWTFRLGIGRVFWGVTESRHLVDIVNQTDQVEDIDEEDKLGQPMISLERYTRAGTFGVFLLPGFRERTFPAADARLRGPLPVAGDLAVYESGRGHRRTDVAVRWEQSAGDWDVGLSGFHGTGREPRLVPAVVEGGREALVPYYDVIGQVGLDLQLTHGAWLLKLEAIRRSGQGRTFSAFAAGLEYTIYAIGDTGADLGLLAEVHHDGRDAFAPATTFDDDVFVGARIARNDINDTMLLLGMIADRDDHGTVSFVEGERRLWKRWRLEVELRWLKDVEERVLEGFSRDSFLTLRLARYF